MHWITDKIEYISRYAGLKMQSWTGLCLHFSQTILQWYRLLVKWYHRNSTTKFPAVAGVALGARPAIGGYRIQI